MEFLVLVGSGLVICMTFFLISSQFASRTYTTNLFHEVRDLAIDTCRKVNLVARGKEGFSMVTLLPADLMGKSYQIIVGEKWLEVRVEIYSHRCNLIMNLTGSFHAGKNLLVNYGEWVEVI
jgi:hypothetical protein